MEILLWPFFSFLSTNSGKHQPLIPPDDPSPSILLHILALEALYNPTIPTAIVTVVVTIIPNSNPTNAQTANTGKQNTEIAASTIESLSLLITIGNISWYTSKAVPKIKSFEAKLLKNRNFAQRLADTINSHAGSFTVFIIHIIVFSSWVVFNKFDPYPYQFLTMVVSLEAIFLSIFVLMSQNRQAQIDSLREEIHLQINEIAEREITKVLKLVSEIYVKNFPDKPLDPEVKKMLREINTSKIEAEIERQLRQR